MDRKLVLGGSRVRLCRSELAVPAQRHNQKSCAHFQDFPRHGESCDFVILHFISSVLRNTVLQDFNSGYKKSSSGWKRSERNSKSNLGDSLGEDVWSRPICSYEIAILVKLTFSLSWAVSRLVDHVQARYLSGFTWAQTSKASEDGDQIQGYCRLLAFFCFGRCCELWAYNLTNHCTHWHT